MCGAKRSYAAHERLCGPGESLLNISIIYKKWSNIFFGCKMNMLDLDCIY